MFSGRISSPLRWYGITNVTTSPGLTITLALATLSFTRTYSCLMASCIRWRDVYSIWVARYLSTRIGLCPLSMSKRKCSNISCPSSSYATSSPASAESKLSIGSSSKSKYLSCVGIYVILYIIYSFSCLAGTLFLSRVRYNVTSPPILQGVSDASGLCLYTTALSESE